MSLSQRPHRNVRAEHEAAAQQLNFDPLRQVQLVKKAKYLAAALATCLCHGVGFFNHSVCF